MKPKKIPPQLEKETQKQILEYLAYRPGKYWRQNTGKMCVGKRWISFGTPGAADITGVRDGRRIEIEIKRVGEVQSEDQILYEKMIVVEGGFYMVAYSLQDVIDAGF